NEAGGRQNQNRNGHDEPRILAIAIDEFARLHGLASASFTRTSRQRVETFHGMKYSSQPRSRSALTRARSLYGRRFPISKRSGSSMVVILCSRVARSLNVSERTSLRSRR